MRHTMIWHSPRLQSGLMNTLSVQQMINRSGAQQQELRPLFISYNDEWLVFTA